MCIRDRFHGARVRAALRRVEAAERAFDHIVVQCFCFRNVAQRCGRRRVSPFQRGAMRHACPRRARAVS
eukprot:5157355-Lingulodinium_polyedra.AAC.1